MAYDALTTSGINNLINSYKTAEQNKLLTPLNTRKTFYQNLTTGYTTLASKLESLKSLLLGLKSTETSSVYYSKSATSSNSNYVSVTSSAGAVAGTYSIRTSQLAKNDVALSLDLNKDEVSTEITVPGTHQFTIKTGDGSGGEFTSTVTVTFEESDFTNGEITNSAVIEKIQNAINSDKAVVTSNAVTGDTLAEGSFVIDLNGTETTINYSAGSYSDVLDSIVQQINTIGGLSAEKVIDGENFQLKMTVNDSSKYLTIKDDTSSLLSELGISVTKEKGASGLVSASAFSPVTGTTQLSLTSKNSGNDYKITALTDNSGNALSLLGLNLGTGRQLFVQSEGADTPGFLYSTSQLNAKFVFNGVNVERNSNTFSDLISGSTVTLKSVMQVTDADVNISVANDVSKIKEKLQEFVTKFNDVFTFIRNNSKNVDGKRGAFIGDPAASSMLSTLSGYGYSSVSGIASDKINTLSKLGITFDSNSGLTISDSTQLENAANYNLDEIVDLFTSTNGIAVNLYDRIDSYIGSSGFLTKSKASYSSSITSLNDRITAVQTRIDKSAEILRQRYIKLQVQLAQLLSNQSYFSTGIE